jgi:hypothetical protein
MFLFIGDLRLIEFFSVAIEDRGFCCDAQSSLVFAISSQSLEHSDMVFSVVEQTCGIFVGILVFKWVMQWLHRYNYRFYSYHTRLRLLNRTKHHFFTLHSRTPYANPRLVFDWDRSSRSGDTFTNMRVLLSPSR